MLDTQRAWNSCRIWSYVLRGDLTGAGCCLRQGLLPFSYPLTPCQHLPLANPARRQATSEPGKGSLWTSVLLQCRAGDGWGKGVRTNRPGAGRGHSCISFPGLPCQTGLLHTLPQTAPLLRATEVWGRLWSAVWQFFFFLINFKLPPQAAVPSTQSLWVVGITVHLPAPSPPSVA